MSDRFLQNDCYYVHKEDLVLIRWDRDEFRRGALPCADGDSCRQ